MSKDERDDVNEAVEQEWVDDTTPFERVHTVVSRTYEPASAATIADRARTTPTTARKHLRTLADTGDVATTQEGQTTYYHRSEASLVTERAKQLLDEHTTDELVDGIARMKAQIRDWRREYDVDSPEEFARSLPVEDADTEHARVLSEWQTTRRNLAMVQAALAVGEATRTAHLTGRDEDEEQESSASA